MGRQSPAQGYMFYGLQVLFLCGFSKYVLVFINQEKAAENWHEWTQGKEIKRWKKNRGVKRAGWWQAKLDGKKYKRGVADEGKEGKGGEEADDKDSAVGKKGSLYALEDYAEEEEGKKERASGSVPNHDDDTSDEDLDEPPPAAPPASPHGRPAPTTPELAVQIPAFARAVMNAYQVLFYLKKTH